MPSIHDSISIAFTLQKVSCKNDAAIHFEKKEIGKITTQQLLKTFQTNIFSFFWITKYALTYLSQGSSIINSASVTAYLAVEC